MTDNLYLILHKVRGEPAFDVATQLEDAEGAGAAEKVWIIPTSGHRAYPSWSYPLLDLYSHPDVGSLSLLELWGGELPPDVPDHYTVNDALSAKPKPVIRHPVTRTEDFLI